MENAKFFRGKLYCTKCIQEKQEGIEHRWGYREVSQLFVQEDGTYVALCFEHIKPKDVEWKREHLALIENCFHFPWRDVVRLTLHKIDKLACDRKGDIMTLEMRDVPNTELMRQHAVEAAHGLQLMADERATVHQLGETGEGNYCWTETNYNWQAPVTCTIRDKYWGDNQIVVFQDVCRLMASIHGWELVDETLPLLDRMVKALDNDGE